MEAETELESESESESESEESSEGQVAYPIVRMILNDSNIDIV